MNWQKAWKQWAIKWRPTEPPKTEKKPFLQNHLQRFLFCLPFTLVLMLHMIPGLHIHFLMNPWVQAGTDTAGVLCRHVFLWPLGIKSLRNGIPNMNVLITTGALAAFVYSLTGAIMGLGDDYLFFETAATIITLVFLGEYLEHASVQRTQRSLSLGEIAKGDGQHDCL
jgi:Cu+-exporting ATPase